MKLRFWSRTSAPALPAPQGSDLASKKRTWLSRSLSALFKSAQPTSNEYWTGTPVPIDAFVQMHHTRLVARSREQWSNNDYVRAFIRLIRQNVIGPHGITLQAKAKKPRGGLDKEACEAIEADWKAWGKKGVCDVTGKMSWREIQRLCVETAARDGEFIVRKVYGADAGPQGFALQMIDPQRLPTWYETGSTGVNGNFIRFGIEFNRYGRAVAYHFSSTDENDGAYYTYSGRGFIRVPADQVIHEFVHECVGQKRGLPWASTSLFRLHHLQGFEDAAVQNARAGATKMGFIQYRDGFGPELEDDEAVTVDAEPLSFHELPEGAEFKEFNPNYPSGEFATFHKAMLRGAAAGMGVLYNNVAGDLEGVNFSSIRQGTLDEREHYKELQEWLVEALCEPTFNAWIEWRLLSGEIKTKTGKPLPAERLSVYREVSWQPRRWQWIDPGADVKAAIESIRAGLTSPSQVIREQGRDPETVFAELAEDIKAMKAAGIAEDMILAFILGPKLAPQKAPANEQQTDKAEA